MLDTLLSGPNLMFLGVLIWSAFMMRSAAVKSRRSRNRDVAQELQTELRARQRSAEGQFHQLEVRLHDYDRDVSARVATTMAMLDQLIAEADREIGRLESLRDERQAGSTSSLPPEQRRMVVHLAGAGYSTSEIAKLIDRPAEVVASVLTEDQTQGQRAA
jgi:DNA-directed RNA polymerase specialized sigma24 family protein